MYTYSYVFKLQLPSKYSPFDAIHPSRHFFHHSKQFLNSLILIGKFKTAAAVFCFTSSTLAKGFPSRTFFIQGNKPTKKPNTDSHNDAIWSTNTDGFLEYSPSKGSLYNERLTCQKIILFWGDPSSYLCHVLPVCLVIF